MNKHRSLVLLTIVSLGLFGCPYESKIPISKPTEKVDRNLLGKWESDDEVYNTYVIAPANQYQYNIMHRTIDGQTRNFTGFISIVKGSTFLNAYSDSAKIYYLYRLKIDTGAKTVTVLPFAKNLPLKFTDTTELNNYVWRSMNLRDFYDIDEQAVYKLVNPNSRSFN